MASPLKETALVLEHNPITKIVTQLGSLEKVPSKLKSNQRRWESNHRRNEQIQAMLENHFGLANQAVQNDKMMLIQDKFIINENDEIQTPNSRMSISSSH